MVTIWHNPRCSKSRQTLNLLRIRGFEPEEIFYLKNPPNIEEIKMVLGLLEMKPKELMRKGENIYKELNLSDVNDENQLIEAMFHHPILIERPIVIFDGKAAIGRPPENILNIL